MQSVIERTRAKILLALEIYPFLSASMLNMGIGTSTSGDLWKPILQGLIDEGVVLRTDKNFKNSSGRTQSYTIYHLPRNRYIYGPQDDPSAAPTLRVASAS
jgi:hypothetical protein